MIMASPQKDYLFGTPTPDITHLIFALARIIHDGS